MHLGGAKSEQGNRQPRHVVGDILSLSCQLAEREGVAGGGG